MKNYLNDIKVKKGSTLIDALNILEKGGLGIVFVVDDDDRLVGVLTDTDLRIALLKGMPTNLTVDHYMNKKPIVITENTSKEELDRIKQKMPGKRIIPILNKDGKIVGTEKTRLAATAYTNPVVIMAGGKGKRLLPLTKNMPKPMLTINGRPVLEIIVRYMQGQGFKNFYFSINYHGNKIKEHFRDGLDLGVKIEYLEEEDELGTAGSLTLLKDVKDPFLIINGDVLTNVDFRKIIDYQIFNDYKFTVVLYEYDLQVPFGVAKIKEGNLLGIEEKPIKKFYVNAGIYVADPEIISMIPQGKKFDMNELIEELIENQVLVGCFPIKEYWIDIGQPSEYYKAVEEFSKYF